MVQPILIIGAGPVGLTLASELKRFGIAVRIVDKALQRTDKSKAIVLWSRTLELLDRGGNRGSAPFVEEGFKLHGVKIMTGSRVIGRVGMEDIPSDHAYALTIPQADTERLLEERLNTQGVNVERGTEALAFKIDDLGAEVSLRHPGGEEEIFQTSWLLGCDGAHSSVRHALNAPFVGETLLSDWFLADVHMTGYPGPDTEASIYWHSAGVLLIFPIKPGRYRIIGDLPPSGAKVLAAPTLEQVQREVDRRGPPGTTVFDPIWLSGFRINSRKVAQYRHGRVFLAGDAAHIHSPAGGQGMNTGMQDACNLAWKLAMVAQGHANATLLDSYSSERSEVGNQVLKSAEKLTSVATLRNPLAQLVRNLVGHIALGLPHIAHTVADNMAEVSISYSESPLNGPYIRGDLRPGERVRPEAGLPPFGSGTAPKFALLAEPSNAVATLAAQYGNLVEKDIRPPLHDGGIALVRPDGYLACSTTDPLVIANYLKVVSSAP